MYAHWDARLRNENATLRASLAVHHAAAGAGAAEINGPPPSPPEHVARPETPHEFRVHVPHRPLLGGGGRGHGAVSGATGGYTATGAAAAGVSATVRSFTAATASRRARVERGALPDNPSGTILTFAMCVLIFIPYQTIAILSGTVYRICI